LSLRLGKASKKTRVIHGYLQVLGLQRTLPNLRNLLFLRSGMACPEHVHVDLLNLRSLRSASGWACASSSSSTFGSIVGETPSLVSSVSSARTALRRVWIRTGPLAAHLIGEHSPRCQRTIVVRGREEEDEAMAIRLMMDR
jgi:hypothetical protein